MRLRIAPVAVFSVLAVGCIAYADNDDGSHAKREARAEKQCVREAEQQGMRVERVGDAEQIGKKQYEVRLRVDPRSDDRYGRDDKRYKRKGDDVRVTCRYDDRDRVARIL